MKTEQLCGVVARRLTSKQHELASIERMSSGQKLEEIQLQRELIDLKLAVMAKPPNALDWGVLRREGSLLHEYETQAQADERAEVAKAVESYRSDEAKGATN